MAVDEEDRNARSRPVSDFIDPEIGEKAGILEVRIGTSPPVPFSASFQWPLLPAISSLELDSRKVRQGSLYFALPGLHVDGHDYINHALELGAVAVVHEKALREYREVALYLLVRNSRFAMSPLADAFYSFPSRSMGIIGVTGTEGKSTTVYLIYQLLNLLGKKAGFISTVQFGNGLNVEWNREHQTTPEAPRIHRLLGEMRQNGAEYAVVEASSHGLSKRTNRLGDIAFDAAVMTNVTHEHLEFHGTWEQYRSDKAELFRALDSFSHRKFGPKGDVPAFAVVNADDPSAAFFAAATKARTFTFSTRGAAADLSITRIESGKEGNSYDVYAASTGKTFTVNDNLPGAFNAGNVLASLLVISRLLSLDIDDLIHLVPALVPVRGRMTAISRGQPFEVCVDYAHTPSSFESILPPLRKRLSTTGNRLICLFGSPGERDTQKRALQGKIAAHYSDLVILADEDPRGEDPIAILEEIAQGCETDQDKRHGMIRNETLFLIPHRPEAIRKAFSLARPGDLVLLLGKGHENSIIYANGPVSYDEIREAETALKEMGYK